MYVYIQSEQQLWTVGFFDPAGKWHPESDHDSKESAADRVHWLNGDPVELRREIESLKTSLSYTAMCCNPDFKGW